MDVLQGVDIADSYVLGWTLESACLCFELDISLWPDHPAYVAHDAGEVACYRRAQLIFDNVRHIEGLLAQSEVAVLDQDSDPNYGTIDYLASAGRGRFLLSGEFGDVEFAADPPRLEFMGER
ncbi:MAG: hypothetical protein KDC35_18670 [Acidobacteria bacterium]|nr:hypothetical protein [Acidobacteriota bacterium]